MGGGGDRGTPERTVRGVSETPCQGKRVHATHAEKKQECVHRACTLLRDVLSLCLLRKQDVALLPERLMNKK